MKNIILFDAVKAKPLITILCAIGIFFVTPLFQTINTPLAFDIWFVDLTQKPTSSIPYITFSALFGMFISLYLYIKNTCIDCKKKVKTGFGGTTLGLILGVCPACFSFVGFLLPLSGSLFLTAYAPLFILVSIGIMLFSINKMGGFKKASIDFTVNEKQSQSKTE
ncbi:MAG: hypothetical protein WAO91_05260 [Candidatus Nitrosotenuis sp.]